MKTKTIYSLTALIFSLTAQASDPTDFGVAEMRTEALIEFKNEWLREELNFLSSIDPFPSGDLPAIDPLSRKRVSRVLVGPAFRTRAHGSNYDYYRYVTFYNVRIRKDRVYEQPILRELCHNKSALSAGVSVSSSYSATIMASASIQGLGLTASMTKSRNFSLHQEITPTVGIIADHTSYFLKQDWTGRTHIQLYNSKTGKASFLKKEQQQSEWWVYVLFPHAAKGKYPMDFQVLDADRTFVLERNIIGTCDDGFGTG